MIIFFLSKQKTSYLRNPQAAPLIPSLVPNRRPHQQSPPRAGTAFCPFDSSHPRPSVISSSSTPQHQRSSTMHENIFLFNQHCQHFTTPLALRFVGYRQPPTHRQPPKKNESSTSPSLLCLSHLQFLDYLKFEELNNKLVHPHQLMLVICYRIQSKQLVLAKNKIVQDVISMVVCWNLDES